MDIQIAAYSGYKRYRPSPTIYIVNAQGHRQWLPQFCSCSFFHLPCRIRIEIGLEIEFEIGFKIEIRIEIESDWKSNSKLDSKSDLKSDSESKSDSKSE